LTIPHALLAFTIAAGFLTITPGLDTALILRTAAVEGPQRAMVAGFGVCCGCLLWGLAASVGLGALLAASQLAYSVLRIVGACYLVVLGLKLLLRKGRSGAEMGDAVPSVECGVPVNVSPSWWFVRGLLTNLLNPKVGLFYVTFLPQFIPAGVSITPFSVLLASIHAAEGILWFSILTLATRPLARWLKRPRVVLALDQATGAVLVGFGLGLVFDRRR
jgi:threonine/homoserine/homoserine lactone efflux protein